MLRSAVKLDFDRPICLRQGALWTEFAGAGRTAWANRGGGGTVQVQGIGLDDAIGLSDIAA